LAKINPATPFFGYLETIFKSSMVALLVGGRHSLSSGDRLPIHQAALQSFFEFKGGLYNVIGFSNQDVVRPKKCQPTLHPP
jgi:hypothetical protein